MPPAPPPEPEQPPPVKGAPPPPAAPPPAPTPAFLTSNLILEVMPKLCAKKLEFNEVLKKVPVSIIPPMVENYEIGYYTRLMDTVPAAHLTVPLLLDTVFEQVCLNAAGSDANQEEVLKDQRAELEHFFNLSAASLTGLSTAGPDADAAEGAPSLTLRRHGDEHGARSANGGALQRKVEAAKDRVRTLMALPGDDYKYPSTLNC